jgi:hypothetical protein
MNEIFLLIMEYMLMYYNMNDDFRRELNVISLKERIIEENVILNERTFRVTTS